MATLNDIHHFFGGDITMSVTGDLRPVTGTELGQQRVLRRLLTNPGDYIFHTDYGAGLPAKVGSTLNQYEITALIRGQMLLEDAVAKSPEPEITVKPFANGVSVYILYTDADSQQRASLSFNVNR